MAVLYSHGCITARASAGLRPAMDMVLPALLLRGLVLSVPVRDHHRLHVGGILSTRLESFLCVGEAVVARHHGVQVHLACRGEVDGYRVSVRVAERACQSDLPGLDERERHARLFVRAHSYYYGEARWPDAVD